MLDRQNVKMSFDAITNVSIFSIMKFSFNKLNDKVDGAFKSFDHELKNELWLI